jgi:hypothetical protein
VPLTLIRRDWTLFFVGFRSWRKRARWTWHKLIAAPSAIRIVVIAIVLAVVSATNLVYQVVRKPTEMFFPVSDAMNKMPAETWQQYAPLFREYSTATITPELAEKASIESRDLFGQKRFDPYDLQGDDNPFAVYLKALTTGCEDITITAVGRTSTEYRVCRSEATELAGGNKQVADWLLNGEVPIHKIPRGLKTVEERIEQIRQNKISVSRVREEIIEEFPGDLDIDIDIPVLDLDSF